MNTSKSTAIFFAVMIGATLLGGTSAFAGASGKGGGDGVVCTNPSNGERIEMLDYYEARLTTNLTLDLGPRNAPYTDKIKYALARLAKIDPITAKRYLERAQNFLSETKFDSDQTINAIRDNSENVKPGLNCAKKQFAIQIFDLKPGQFRYLVNRDLWKIADSETKAGLILHEAIYRDAYDAGQTDSDNTRYFNAWISSKQFSTLTPKQYLDLVGAAQLANNDNFSIRGSTIIPTAFMSSLNFDSGAQISRAKADPTILKNASITISGNVVGGTVTLANGIGVAANDVSCTMSSPPSPNDGCSFATHDVNSFTSTVFGQQLDNYGNLTVNISLNGDVRSGFLKAPLTLSLGGHPVSLVAGDFVEFGENGRVDGFSTRDNHPYPVTILGQPVSLDFVYSTGIYPNGVLRYASVSSSSPDLSLQGQTLQGTNLTLEFWPNGALKTIIGAYLYRHSPPVIFTLFNGEHVTLSDDGNRNFNFNSYGQLIGITKAGI